jgi:hypothetical protein
MGPVNAMVRFVCELVALFGIGVGAWAWTGSVLATVLLPVGGATIWGVFRVPDDPGPPPVEVPGVLRLLIEATVFASGVWGLLAAYGPVPGVAFGFVLIAHYATTPRRLSYVISCRGWGRPAEPPAN